jgi:hypothetical protein
MGVCISGAPVRAGWVCAPPASNSQVTLLGHFPLANARNSRELTSIHSPQHWLLCHVRCEMWDVGSLCKAACLSRFGFFEFDLGLRGGGGGLLEVFSYSYTPSPEARSDIRQIQQGLL